MGNYHYYHMAISIVLPYLLEYTSHPSISRTLYFNEEKFDLNFNGV